jgi:hypothetical protein
MPFPGPVLSHQPLPGRHASGSAMELESDYFDDIGLDLKSSVDINNIVESIKLKIDSESGNGTSILTSSLDESGGNQYVRNVLEEVSVPSEVDMYALMDKMGLPEPDFFGDRVTLEEEPELDTSGAPSRWRYVVGSFTVQL